MSDVDEAQQTLTSHLTELRVRLVRTLLIIGGGFIVSMFFSEKIFNVIRQPILPHLPPGQGLVFTAPADEFIAHIKMAFLAGMILTCPLWLYQVWAFVSPGLYKKEKKYAMNFIFSGSLLFLTGVSFTYFVVLPAAFKYLLGFGGGIDKPMITISDYFSFFFTMTIAFGVSFEMPLVLVLLGLMGIIDEKFLAEKRRFAIVGMSVLAAVITPPDALSMLMMFVPLVILYESAIIVLKIIRKKNKNVDLETPSVSEN